MERTIVILLSLCCACEFGNNEPDWSYSCDYANCGDNAVGSTTGTNYLHCQYEDVNPKGYDFCDLYSVTFTAYGGCWQIQQESCY